MSRFRKLSQIIWHCQYHIVWVTKYRFRVRSDRVAEEVGECIRTFSEQQACEIFELNVQVDHFHLQVLVPQKVTISGYVETIKGRTAIQGFNRFPKLKKKPYGAETYSILFMYRAQQHILSTLNSVAVIQMKDFHIVNLFDD